MVPLEKGAEACGTCAESSAAVQCCRLDSLGFSHPGVLRLRRRRLPFGSALRGVPHIVTANFGAAEVPETPQRGQ